MPYVFYRHFHLLALNVSHVYSVYMTELPMPQKIIQAANRLLKSQGIDAVTMRGVAELVGVTPMALYRHYSDRAVLLNALADDGFLRLSALLKNKRITGTLENRLIKMAEIYLDLSLENPKLFELMFLTKRKGARVYPRDFKARSSPTATLVADALAEGMASGEFKKDDHWEICFELGALTHGLIMLYIGERIEMSASEFRALYRRSIRRHIHGIQK